MGKAKLFILFMVASTATSTFAIDEFDIAVCSAYANEKERLACFDDIAKNTKKTPEKNQKKAAGKVEKSTARHLKTERKYSNRIASYAFSPYTQQSYPETVAKFGARLPEIEELRRSAAYMALDSGKCDFVEMVELKSSSPVNAPKFWIDCRNGERIYLTESEITKDSAVRTQSEKSWSKSAAIKACKKAIKDRALIPSGVDIHEILGTTYRKAPVSHNVVLNMNFDAKNALGNEIPYKAKCHFSPGEVGTIDIQYR